MQFVDERDDLAVGVVDFFEHCLEALFEFAPVLRAGNQSAHVERNELLAFKAVSHVARDNALSEPLNDGSLAHAGFTNEDRVVLGASSENLADTADFRVPADDRVELSAFRNLGQVHAELLERALLSLLCLFSHESVCSLVFWLREARGVLFLGGGCVAEHLLGRHP